jgi:cellulose biosynthesis protein BcsQ
LKTIAVYSIKGGVGKTAAAVNLAHAASREGSRTILCDLDPQGSATYYFRVRPARKFGPRKLIAGGAKMEKKIRGTDYYNLDLLPASLNQRNLDIALDSARHSKTRLRDSLAGLKEQYDYVFLDCPPGITLVAENIFRAADRIIVPFIPTTLSHLSYGKLLEFLDEKDHDSDSLRAFFSMAESRKRLHRDVMERMSREDRRFLDTVVPYMSDIERMGVRRAPVTGTKPYSLAARRYFDLWEEIKDLFPKSERFTRR